MRCDHYLGEEVGGHADTALSGTQGSQGEILVRDYRQLSLQQGIQNYELNCQVQVQSKIQVPNPKFKV